MLGPYAQYPAIGYPSPAYALDTSYEDGSATNPYYQSYKYGNYTADPADDECVYRAWKTAEKHWKQMKYQFKVAKIIGQ